MTEVTARAKNAAPKVVYTDMVHDMEVDDAPRNSRVISNKQYRDRSNDRRNKGAGHRANFADEMQSLCSMIASDSSFLREVSLRGGRVPTLTLFTDRQLAEVKAFCFNAVHGSVWSCNKTYNVGKLYLTVTVYRRVATGDIPIFIGPVFVHGNSDFETYAHFFGTLAAKLHACDYKQLRLGSDEESSIRKAFQQTFPGAALVTCTRHIKENVRRNAHKVQQQSFVVTLCTIFEQAIHFGAVY